MGPNGPCCSGLLTTTALVDCLATRAGAATAQQVTHPEATYTLADSDPLEILHHGQPVNVSAGKPQTRPIPAAPSRPRPSQPPGREPAHRRPIQNTT
jgi:hypothetical protein